MGLGHVPAGPLRDVGARAHDERRERRGAAAEGRLSRRRVALERGRWAEAEAARFYERQGYRVVARNVRVGRSELDLVVERDGVIVVCEVKYRNPRSGHDPLEALRPAQRARLRRATGAWLASRGRGVGRARRVRLDLVAIGGPGLVDVVEDAW